MIPPQCRRENGSMFFFLLAFGKYFIFNGQGRSLFFYLLVFGKYFIFNGQGGATLLLENIRYLVF